MEHVTVDDLPREPYDESLHTDRRDLSAALGTTDVAIARYALDPGERFSGSLHDHTHQEEVFVVLEGEASFEVETEDGTDQITVGADEAVRFAPGEFQTGRNDGDEPLVALAIGAPKDGGDVLVSRIPVLDDRDVACPDCGLEYMRISREGPGLVCPECDARTEVE